MSLSFPLVDAWVNPNLGTPSDPRYDVEYLFPELAERWRRKTTLTEMIAMMDEAGVGISVLCSGYGGVDDVDDVGWVLDAHEKHPDRFLVSHAVDPRRGMDAVREVEAMVTQHDCRLIRMVGFEIGLPYTDPAYYPIFAKCVELDVPVGLNVGIPGPLIAGLVQHPIAIDTICAFFPDLKIIMQHGGEPWIDICVKLLLKWPNVFYMTSAFAPKRVPGQILHLANSRGADKIMWASDFPLLTFSRCASEIAEMSFRDEERRQKFARENALTVLSRD